MDFVIHHIRVRDGIDPECFVEWVRAVDYVSCPDLPSVRRFEVARLSAATREFVEVIAVTDLEAFKQDMATPTFRRLETEFFELAEVVSTNEATRVEPGYVANPDLRRSRSCSAVNQTPND